MSNFIIAETEIKPTIAKTEILVEVGNVIGVGGTFMLDDSTKVTIIEAADPDPAITQTKELLIRKNS